MEEPVIMDRRTENIAVNEYIHTRSNTAKLYMQRKEGGRFITEIEECAEKK